MITGKMVFDPNDQIEKNQARKELFSKAVFGNIVEKAKKGDVEAVRWLVETRPRIYERKAAKA